MFHYPTIRASHFLSPRGRKPFHLFIGKMGEFIAAPVVRQWNSLYPGLPKASVPVDGNTFSSLLHSLVADIVVDDAVSRARGCTRAVIFQYCPFVLSPNRDNTETTVLRIFRCVWLEFREKLSPQTINKGACG